MNLANDREMTRFLGLGDLTLQELLSKTRQAIHAGLAERQYYFRRSELQVIYMFVLKHMRDKANAFEAYILATRSKEEAAPVLSLEGFNANPSLEPWVTELFAVVPDFLYLRHENRAGADYLISLCREDVEVTYLVADEREREALQRAIHADGVPLPKANILVEPETSALPYMVFASAGGGRHVAGYVLSDFVFREMPSFRANQIFTRVSEWTKSKKIRPERRVAARRRG